jgi:hypothetical protein
MRARGEKQVVIQATFGEGIESAIRRVAARDRKRASRANVGRVELNLPAGTAAALERVCEAAGDAPVALLSQQIHKLDQLLAGDRAAFDAWVRYGNNVAGVAARHIERIGGDSDE